MMGDYWGTPWYGMMLGPIMMIAVLAAIIVVVMSLVCWLGGGRVVSPPYSSPEKSPLDVLKERFARGEIEKQEFEEKKRTLSE